MTSSGDKQKLYICQYNYCEHMKSIYDFGASKIVQVALGSGVVVLGTDEARNYLGRELPHTMLMALKKTKKRMKYVALGPDYQFFLMFEDNSWMGKCPDTLKERITQVRGPVRALAFLKNNGWVLIREDGKPEWSRDFRVSPNEELFQRLRDAKSAGIGIDTVSTGGENGWFLRLSDGSCFWNRDFDSRLFRGDMEKIQKQNGDILQVDFGDNRWYYIMYSKQTKY
eukprot:TRINITY_DN6077_c0_g1_i12.p1 TRINITY_DN6077_c0_g1~~TRINITY_DN6077_c0_g1_i12.p1  ORF type:complete len:226 (+),score=45.63 TRINITY_DN6077_c0_g1_i12:167-844(+)